MQALNANIFLMLQITLCHRYYCSHFIGEKMCEGSIAQVDRVSAQYIETQVCSGKIYAFLATHLWRAIPHCGGASHPETLACFLAV